MARSNRRNPFVAVVGAFALAGCFMEVEADSMTAQSPTFQMLGIPLELQTPTLLNLVGALTFIEIPIGNSEGTGFVAASKNVGPITLEGTLTVNQAILENTTAGASLAGIRTLELWQLSNPSCQPGDSTCRIKVAEYRGGATAGQVTLLGTGVDALPFLYTDPQTSKKAFLLQLQGSGTFPTTSWQGLVTIDCHLKDKGTWP